MPLRLAVPAVLIGLAAAALPATASSAIFVEHRGASVVRGDLGATTGSPQAWALRAVARHFDATGLRVESVRESVVGTHVRGREYRRDVPVDGSHWLVSAVGGRIVQVQAHRVTLPGTAVPRPVGVAAVRAAALQHLSVVSLLVPTATERLLVARGGALADVHRVSVVAGKPAVAAVVEVDSATGRVQRVIHEARYADGSANVFDPNPIVTKRDTRLRQPLEPGTVEGSPVAPDPDLDSADLTAQRRRLPLKDLDPTALASGRLSGPWVNVIGTGYNATSAPGQFDLTRSDPRFEGLMAYAHLDRFQRYLQSLGFTGTAAVNAESQDVLAVPIQGYDQSNYRPFPDLITLGAGGVDDGEDAEVILHEYGHAMQDAQVPDYGLTHEGLAMGEGFGDFLAGAYYARTSMGFNDVCLMEWDSTSYRTTPQTCLRRMDVAKVWPDDRTNQVHEDGEIWSSYLWDLRATMPGSATQKSDAALKLVVSMHEFLTPAAKFADAVAALRTAARALRHPEYVKSIDRLATKRGFDLEP